MPQKNELISINILNEKWTILKVKRMISRLANHHITKSTEWKINQSASNSQNQQKFKFNQLTSIPKLTTTQYIRIKIQMNKSPMQGREGNKHVLRTYKLHNNTKNERGGVLTGNAWLLLLDKYNFVMGIISVSMGRKIIFLEYNSMIFRQDLAGMTNAAVLYMM